MSDETTPQVEPTAEEHIPGAPSTDGTTGPVGSETGSAAPVEDDGGGEGQDKATDWQQQAKHFQRLHDRQHETVIKPLKPVLDAYEPKQVAGFVSFLEKAYRHPRMKEILEHFDQQGDVPDIGRSAQREEGKVDEDLDDFVSKRELMSALEEANRKIERLQNDYGSKLTSLEMSEGDQKAKSVMQQFVDRNPEMTDEERKQFFESLDSTWSSLSRTPEGIQTMKRLDYDSFESLGLKKLNELGILPNIYARRFQNQGAQREAGATDAPSRVSATTGREAGSEPKPASTRTEIEERMKRISQEFASGRI